MKNMGYRRPENQTSDWPIKLYLQPSGYAGRFWNAVKFAFKDDTEMHKYHQKPLSDVTCMARHTYRQIGKSKERGGTILKCYTIVCRDEKKEFHIIGFTVLCKFPIPILFSFGINVNFRRKEILTKWLEAVRKEIGTDYAVTLNLKNSRAIMFFERNGFVQQATNKKLKIVSMSKPVTV